MKFCFLSACLVLVLTLFLSCSSQEVVESKASAKNTLVKTNESVDKTDIIKPDSTLPDWQTTFHAEPGKTFFTMHAFKLKSKNELSQFDKNAEILAIQELKKTVNELYIDLVKQIKSDTKKYELTDPQKIIETSKLVKKEFTRFPDGLYLFVLMRTDVDKVWQWINKNSELNDMRMTSIIRDKTAKQLHDKSKTILKMKSFEKFEDAHKQLNK